MKIGRFVVDGHLHGSTRYEHAKTGLPKAIAKRIEEEKARGLHPSIVEPYDNSDMCIYDMDCFGVDMAIILPSYVGTRNEMVAQMVEKHPTRFRGCAMSTTLNLKVAIGEAKWSIEAALEEIEAAFNWGKGKFVGIGEFVPRNPERSYVYTVRERLDEWRKIADLVVKYDLVADSHYESNEVLSRIIREYPDAKIVIKHGGQTPGGRGGEADEIRAVCRLFLQGADNVYMETGYWPAEYYEIALKDPNIGATQLIWGGGDTGSHTWTRHMTRPGARFRDPAGIGPQRRFYQFPVQYQTNFYSWPAHQIHRLLDLNLATQDEIELIVGGNAAKIYKLPVPLDRMFMCGRADISGIHWQKTIPFLPPDQIQPRDPK